MVAKTKEVEFKKAFLPSDPKATIRLRYADNVDDVAVHNITVDLTHDSCIFDNDGNYQTGKLHRTDSMIEDTRKLAIHALEMILEFENEIKGTIVGHSEQEIKAAEYALASLQSKMSISSKPKMSLAKI